MAGEPLDTVAQLDLAPLRRLTGHLERLVKSHLWLQVVLGMMAGVGAGMLLGPSVGWVDPELASAITSWLALPGRLFIVLIQMIVVPLVFASVIRGLGASDDMRQLKSLGLRAAGFFVLTTAGSIALGLGGAAALRPGRFIDPREAWAMAGADAAPTGTETFELPSLGQLPAVITGVFPTNPLESMVGGQMLQVILFAIVLGVALVSLTPDKSAPLFDLLGSLQEVCMAVVRGAMRLAPIAVFGLMAKLTAQVGLDVLAGLAGYMGTVLLGLLLLSCFYLALVAVVGRMSPLRFLSGAREVLLLAFSTSSSAAVMPLSISTAEDALGVRPSVARFLIPLGATVNMNGTALYQGVATMFLAQVYDVPLTAAGLSLVVVTATAASIGSPATPGVGIVILATVLSGIGIPAAGVALIIGVDRLLDMCRTAANVAGDLTAAVVLDRTLPDATPTAPGVPEAQRAGDAGVS